MSQLLEATKAATLKKADPRLVPLINRMVKAGEDVMFSPQTRAMSLQALGRGDSPETIGAAVAKLMGVLFNQSKNTAPMQVMVPAATILLCDALNVVEQGGGAQVTPDFLAQCTAALGSNFLQLFGVTPDKLQGMVDKSGAPQAAPGTSVRQQPAPQPASGGLPILAGAAQGAAA